MYALVALGYSMVYGIAKMFNFAHGDIIMVGGYAIYVMSAKGRASPRRLSLVIVCSLLGIIIEFLAYRPLETHLLFPSLLQLSASATCSRILRFNLTSELGSSPALLSSPPFMGPVRIDGIDTYLDYNSCTMALNYFIQNTKTERLCSRCLRTGERLSSWALM